MDKLGSPKYPISLIPHTSTTTTIELEKKRTRVLLNEAHIKEIKVAGKIPKKSDLLCYIKNVISNPHLTTLEVKCALYLKESICSVLGNLIMTRKARSTNYLNEKLGEDGELYIGTNPEDYLYLSSPDTFNLLDDLNRININCDEDELNEALSRLHGFSYITVTDICWDNVYKRHQRKKIDNKDADFLCKHISIHPDMDNNDLCELWKPISDN
jgi:hypothetical protein